MAATPVVLITAAAHDGEGGGLYAGGSAFLEKPLDLDRLVSVMQVAQNRSELRHRVQDANVESLSRLDLEAARMDFHIDPP